MQSTKITPIIAVFITLFLTSCSSISDLDNHISFDRPIRQIMFQESYCVPILGDRSCVIEKGINCIILGNQTAKVSYNISSSISAYGDSLVPVKKRFSVDDVVEIPTKLLFNILTAKQNRHDWRHSCNQKYPNSLILIYMDKINPNYIHKMNINFDMELLWRAIIKEKGKINVE